MADVQEVRPDVVDLDGLAALERVLDGAGLGVGTRIVGPDGDAAEVPAVIRDLLASVVHHLMAGNGVTVIPRHAELTTVEAAQLLNVSRPHLIKQIESGAIAHRMVGTHRRLRLTDVLRYRDEVDARAAAALDAMAGQAEELGIYEE